MSIKIQKALKADRDDILNNFEIISQLIVKIKKEMGFKIKIIPINVAIPLPPLNFNHIGNICPR